MRRMTLLVALAATGLTAAALAAVGLTAAVLAAAPTLKPAMLAGFKCAKALKALDRSMSIDAVMRTVPRTVHLALQFQVRRVIGRSGRTVNVAGGDLGTWLGPADPTLGQNPNDVWTLRKIVQNLRARARYRFRVTFRWTDGRNRVLRTETRHSRDCAQPDLRPEVIVKTPVAVTSSSRTEDLYKPVIRNVGATVANGPFAVSLTFPPRAHVEPQTVEITRLGPHRSVSLSFIGPKCTAANTPILTVDPKHVLNERGGRNNTFRVACPR